MSPAPALRIARPDGTVRAIALVLHGGRETSTRPVHAGNLAAARMIPFANSLHHAGTPHGLVVARLRYAVRGWNGALRSPVADTDWALRQLTTQFPELPVALVGHSMGGRTALYSAGHPAVRAVVGLAPWIEAGDPTEPMTGRRLLIVHGDHDRMTNPRRSAQYAAAVVGLAESVGYVGVRGERHAMLRRAPIWHALTTGFVLATMCGGAPTGTDRSNVTNVLMKALAGDTALVI